MVTDSLAVVAGVIALLLGLSAFFSASEIAVFSLERHRLSALRDGSDSRGNLLARLRDDPHRLLVTILVGNNLVNISMASLATVAMVGVFGAGAGVTVATAVMSVLILVIGEIAPKSYGVANAERTALRVARPLGAIQRVLYPVVAVFEWIATRINKLTGSDNADRPELTRIELERLIATGERVGAIDTAERAMVEAIFEFGETSAREVMVPRPNVVAVDRDTPLAEIVGRCADERTTRVPVYEDNLDHVVGVVDIRDAERALREGLTLDDVLISPLIVPDSQRIDTLLTEMQAERHPMAVVVDEYGEMEGVVTIEDILEEIVGDIFEVGEERFVRATTDGLVVKGEVTVGEINDILGVALPRHGDYETVAGLINAELGRLGEVDDTVAFPDVGITLSVEAVERNRIRRVRVSRDGVETGETDDS
ncbi:HlyC/CorC family transporter [Halonotius terrestris]|uniref:HlyC/CorC family transporter n=1 Tax=Halonotius terrestris TaxID=2487750 RepID=A0A8J8PDB0_9EURY|nr:hemolysin family protein [Halonotius terrestris]TQQ81344.1 HlyC/CorC family transporter [Halonotius terrestris]